MSTSTPVSLHGSSTTIIRIPKNSSSNTIKDTAGNSLAMDQLSDSINMQPGNTDFHVGAFDDSGELDKLTIKIALYSKPDIKNSAFDNQKPQPVLDTLNGDPVVFDKLGGHSYSRTRGGDILYFKITEAKNTSTTTDQDIFLCMTV